MFRRAVISLTLWYLVIIMGLSLGFSLFLYSSSARELTANEQRQENALRRNLYIPFDTQRPILQEAQNQLQESLESIVLSLVYFNLLILVGGGAISYFLAKRTLQPIQETAETQTRFAGDASHELRTPLAAIRAELEVSLRDPKLTLKESKELHKSTLEEVAKLEALSGALLRLSQHDQESSRATFKECDLPQIIGEAAKGRSQIMVEDLPQTVKGDFWSLVELFSVLLDNAIKYSPKDEAITVSGKTMGDHRASISIIDHGQGISAEDLPHIFDRFYRADRSRTSVDNAGGHGLGLSIAKQIIDLHHGSIEVASMPDKGSVFTVTLPV